eukprot:TRINITY_DN2266_c0_g1_i10.p1 TRINITY_DN2266_c0_g1~~TRINITY_DN2266_c0_g1_i10.p1  ORF type:complete len:221 (+),score=42.38 TRINITY_DN2266_c0_g1_i10:147-809(+)
MELLCVGSGQSAAPEPLPATPTAAPTQAPEPEPASPTPRPPTPTDTLQPESQPPPSPTGNPNCVVSKEFGFDSEEELRSAGGHVALSTQTKHSGAGSMLIKEKERSSFFKFESLQPAHFSVSARVESTNAHLTFRLHTPGQGLVKVVHAGDGRLHHNRLGRGWWRWVTSESDAVRLGVFQQILVASGCSSSLLWRSTGTAAGTASASTGRAVGVGAYLCG